ncbi:MAG TPA: hypothetical protein VIM17_12870 [Jatrophihabitantaceae bacterium]|jgi:hypothetical protein
MTEPRDYNDVYAEQVAGFAAAVAAAVSTANADQATAQAFLDGGLPATVWPAEPLAASPSVTVEQANEPPEAPAL